MIFRGQEKYILRTNSSPLHEPAASISTAILNYDEQIDIILFSERSNHLGVAPIFGIEGFLFPLEPLAVEVDFSDCSVQYFDEDDLSEIFPRLDLDENFDSPFRWKWELPKVDRNDLLYLAFEHRFGRIQQFEHE